MLISFDLERYLGLCKDQKIRRRACRLVIKLTTQPEIYLVKYLKNRKIKHHLISKLKITSTLLDWIVNETEMSIKGCETCHYSSLCPYLEHLRGRRLKLIADDIIFLERNCPFYKSYHYAVTYQKIHKIWNLSQEEILLRDIIKGIMEYFYGKQGIKAVDLYFELYETPYVVHEIKRNLLSLLTKNISGTLIDKDGICYTLQAFIGKYLKKDVDYLISELKKMKQYQKFLTNLRTVLFMRASEFLMQLGKRYYGILKNKRIYEIIMNNTEEFTSYIKLLKHLAISDLMITEN